MGHSLLCMMGFFLLSTVICGNAEDNITHSQDADEEEEQTTSAQRDEFGVNSGNSNLKTDSTTAPIKPTVAVQPFWTQIYSGETVTVRCEIQGGEGAQWTYEWSPAKINTPPTSNEYKITVTESDSGGYSCRGRRSSSWTEWSNNITLRVIAPPEPTVFLQPSGTQIHSSVIYRGENLTVRCEIQGGEGAQWKYEWRAAKLNTPPTSREYTISGATKSDGGGYSCRGKRDSSWTEWSDNITLTVLSPSNPTVTLHPSWTQIYSGETVTVRCEIQGGEGAQWTYEWRPAKLNTPPTSSEYTIIRATESDGGGYSCRGRADRFFTEWSDIITLTVSSPPEPTVTLHPSWTQIYSGEAVTVRCEIQGGEGAQWMYVWRRGQINIHETSNEYKIITATESDRGGYSCIGRRGSFYTQWSDSITLTVSSPPKPTVTLQPSWTQIYSGETVTVRCEIQGGEGAQWMYEWRRGQVNIRPTSREYTITVTESDSGAYSCRGRRGSFYTEWSKSITLTVSSPPKPTVFLQPSWTRIYSSVIYSGETVTVRCEIQGGEGAQWTYEWRRGQSSIHPTSSVYTITVTESDGGGYSCRGTRSSSWTEWSDITTLKVTVPIEPTVTLQPSWTQIYSGETVTVRCEIQGGEGAQWTYEWRPAKLSTPPTSNEYRITVTQSDSGGYSCRGRRDYVLTYWSNIRLTVSSKPKAELRADRTAVPVGGSVTLTCSVSPSSSSGWKYYWYRDGKSYEAVTNGETSVSEGGLYSCRGGRGEPVYYTEDSESVRIDTTVSNRPVVTLYPNWSEIYRGETITVRCEIHGGDTEWDYEWETNSTIKPPNQTEYRIRSATSSNSGNYRCKGRMKSSQHKTTEWSDSVTLTVSDNKPSPVLTVSPSWLSPGASVTLNCQVEHPSAGWSFYWYKVVPDLKTYNYKSSSYELLPDGSGTAQDSYIIHGQTHTAGYVCRAGRGDPEYHTDHSQPKFVWSADVHSAASLTVSPDRVQHFTSDSVSLTCEGNFTEWRVRKFSEDGQLYSVCRRMTGSTCNIYTSKSDTGVYWCESGSGEFSSAVNITVQNDGNGPILVSPVHPVTEGASVSLSCSLKTQKILSNVFFYHNDKLIQNDTRGELNISAVSKSDEGFYKCQYSGRESAQSWMSVKVTGPSSSPVWLMVGLVCGVSLIIILLLLLYRCRRSKYSCFTRSIQSESHSPGSSTNHGVNQDETHVYDSVHPGTNNLYESVMPVEDNRNGSDEHQDVTYALIELKNFEKKRKHHKPEQSAVYSEVKTGAAGTVTTVSFSVCTEMCHFIMLQLIIGQHGV
uniref:Ig-like domain-containing protein n=1 Tax=Oreochromis aureus TaxID=47969 RepID=A0AAZ1WVG8_OREAU